jgi:uncharacterized membrane protein
VNPLSGVIGEAWAMYRAHAAHFLTLAFVVYVVAALVQLVLTGSLGAVGALLAAIVSLVAAFLLQAALVKAVDDVRDGRVDLSLPETLQAARPAIVRVAIGSILAGIATGIGFFLLIVPGLYLLTIWCLIVPVLVLEGAAVGAAFGRSRQLVSGFGWQVFGTLVMVFLLLLVVDLLIGLILTSLPDAARTSVSGVVSGTLVAPFLALVVTLGYYRLRNAHEAIAGPA